MTYEDALNIYTDGSSYQRPRRGGVGIRYIVINSDGDEEWEDECPMGYEAGTNNEMELMACVLALSGIPSKYLSENIQKIYIFTDSQYVRNYISYAIHVWPKNKWRNRHGRPIENVGIWKDLVREIRNAKHRVEFKWVKGHSRNKHNKAVDKLAKQSANGVLNRPLVVQSARRKITKESVELGSVGVEGQVLDIRIITDKRMREQKEWKYKYEVLSEDSRYFGKVDIAYSTILLRAHHSYRVRLGISARNPRIEELVGEIDESGEILVDD